MINTPLELVKNARMYMDTQKQPIAYKTFARKMQLTPKDARYVLRVYFNDYIVPSLYRKMKMRKTYYKTPKTL
jgi:hypothetical protein